MSRIVYRADHAWMPEGWARDVALCLEDGFWEPLTAHPVAASKAEYERIGRFAMSGVPNLHSHAFQRAMAGLTERSGPIDDSFWTWREVMYAFAGRIDPDQMQAIAAQLYVEMLKAGYTQVCEFHYLHHQPDGMPHADPAAMSRALLRAADEAGIGITLLPVLYMAGGFDGRPLSARQRRFGHDIDGFLRLVESLLGNAGQRVRIGIALHSLRAVPVDAMRVVLDAVAKMSSTLPIHIHIAEQTAEVEECVAFRGARPVRWLLDNAAVDGRWCLVHATHLDADEVGALAASGAIAGLCPTTEANLGDGFFPLPAFLDGGGRFGVGSDSHASVSPVEELRWLEYGQRLLSRSRNVAARRDGGSVGEALWQAALEGGAGASGVPVGSLAAASRADLVVLDDASPCLAGRDESNVIDSWLFSGNANIVRDVMVAGRWQVRGGCHVDEERIAQRYRRTIDALMR